MAAAPVAAFTWSIEREALPYVAASSAAELAYFLLLAAAYSRSDLSLVYPLARGVAPVVVLAGAVALGASPTGAEIGGVALVGCGVLLVRGLRGGADRRGVALALGVAALIAAYTLIDDRGIEHAEPISYLALVLAPVALAAALLSGRERLRAELRLSTALAGVAGFAAYALVLAALDLAGAAPVAAVRETSVVIAVVLAAPLLGERVTRLRVAGAVLVAGGILLLAA